MPEIQVLIEYVKVLRDHPYKLEPEGAKEQSMAGLEIKVLAGAESKAFLVDLTKVVDRMERAAGILAGKTEVAEVETDDDVPAADEGDDDDFAVKPVKAAVKGAAKKTAAAFEKDDTPAEAEAEEESDDFTATPAKAAKTKPARVKKITLDDVNDACKARAKAGGKKGRAEVLAILKKNFKTESVSDLDEDQYSTCIELMEV